MLVWITDWQVAEDHLLVAVGDVVHCVLYPADLEWVARLFGDRLAIAWQFDTYGGAVVQPSREIRGQVAEVRSVRCHQIQTDEGIVPERGAATLHLVRDTSGSWIRGATVGRPARESDVTGLGWRSYSSIFSDGNRDGLYGYVVTLIDVPGEETTTSS